MHLPLLLMNVVDSLIRAARLLHVKALRFFLRQLGANLSRASRASHSACSENSQRLSERSYLRSWAVLAVVGLRSTTKRMFLSFSKR